MPFNADFMSLNNSVVPSLKIRYKKYPTMILVSFVFTLISCKEMASTPSPSKPKEVCTECTSSLHGSTSTAERCGTEQEVKEFEDQYIMGNQANGATASCERKD